LAHIRKSKFKLPALVSYPLIMVSVGIGFVSFISFLSERKKLADIGRPLGEMILFSWCWNPDEDFIYRVELEEFERQFVGKFRIVTAFLREEKEKVYV
jgi:NADPH-ferrihemoprotein reductase